MSTAIYLTNDQIEFQNYCHSRDEFSFSRMKKEIGCYRAIQWERAYQGHDGLEQQSRVALAQMNDILEALRRPAILRWPTEPLSQCDVCDAKVPVSHIKATGYFDSVNEFAVDGPGCCRKCRRVEDEDSDWLCVEEVIGEIHETRDYYYWIPRDNDQALEVSADCPGADLIDLRNEQPITGNEARAILNDDHLAGFLKLGLGFPETLNLFIGDLIAGLYPSA